MQIAYLIAVFKLVDNVPVFLGVDIFSEPEPTLGGDRRSWVVHQEGAPSFTEAKTGLLDALEHPWRTWVKQHLNRGRL